MATTTSSSSAKSLLVSSQTAQRWTSDGFIQDSTAQTIDMYQECDCLYTGKLPAIGQRIELLVNAVVVSPYAHDIVSMMHMMQSKACRLSGVVLDVLPHNARSLYPQTHFENQEYPASLAYSDLLWNVYRGRLPRGATVVKSTCPYYLTGHRVYMPNATWDKEPETIKRRMDDMIVKKYGALHGQELLCQARVHFDDADRPGLAFDSQDVWQFKLIADDHKNNLWTLKVDTLENLGPNVRASGWPWKADDGVENSVSNDNDKEEASGKNEAEDQDVKEAGAKVAGMELNGDDCGAGDRL